MTLTDRFKNIFKSENSIKFLVVAFFVISLIPLLVIGRYNVLSADDYSMGKITGKVWQENHDMGMMMAHACEYTMKAYHEWQGCFTINFIDCWNPGFFDEGLTWITPILMLVSVVLCMYFFVKNVIMHYYEISSGELLVILALVCFLIIQTMPSPVEGLYWYAGAVAYTMLHYMMLILFSIVIKLDDYKQKNGKLVLTVLAGIWAFVVGGSQYITVLECIICYAFILVISYKKINVYKLIPFLALLVGFGISLFAPGNMVRQSESTGMSPMIAIGESFVKALYFSKQWISPLFVAVTILLIPFVWKIVQKGRRQYKYNYPLIILFFSFCIFAASFTAPLYGVGNVDSGRILNLIQNIYYILFYINLFYCTGWLQNKLNSSNKELFVDIKSILEISKKYQFIYKWIACGLIVLIFVGTGDKNTFSSMSALRSLVKEEAQTYYQESQERLAMYKDINCSIVEVEAYSVKPKVLFFNDVQHEGSQDYWINESIADYYGKDKIVLKKSQ